MEFLALKYSGFKADGDIISFMLGINLKSVALLVSVSFTIPTKTFF